MKPQASIDNVANYANSGGRLFLQPPALLLAAEKMPDFSGTAAYVGILNTAAAATRTCCLTVNQTFPKGMALASGWPDRSSRPARRADRSRSAAPSTRSRR